MFMRILTRLDRIHTATCVHPVGFPELPIFQIVPMEIFSVILFANLITSSEVTRGPESMTVPISGHLSEILMMWHKMLDVITPHLKSFEEF